jgi:hypothetical protein
MTHNHLAFFSIEIAGKIFCVDHGISNCKELKICSLGVHQIGKNGEDRKDSGSSFLKARIALSKLQ